MAMAGPHRLPRPHTRRRFRLQAEFNVRQLAITIIATAAVTMLMTATPTLAEIPSKGKCFDNLMSHS